MCGRFTLRTRLNRLLQDLGLDGLQAEFEWEPKYNIRPTQKIPVIRQSSSLRTLDLLRWGFVPSWTQDKPGTGYINARADGIATKPSFRTAFQKRRCLLLADGYFEWRGKQKEKFFFHMTDDAPFAFAGIWETWNGLDTCALVTTEANALTEPYHDRMPVILDAEAADIWLSATATTDLHELMQSRAIPALQVYPVNLMTGKAQIDAPECVLPL